MSPKYLLAERSKYVSEEQSPKEGIATEKLLEERSKWRREVEAEKSTSPVILFPLSARCSMSGLRSQRTMPGPEILLLERSATRRLSFQWEEELNSRRLLERLRDWRFEHEARKDMSLREPERVF